ncbi:unnamed protein product, partial [Oikopleura dioica]
TVNLNMTQRDAQDEGESSGCETMSESKTFRDSEKFDSGIESTSKNSQMPNLMRSEKLMLKKPIMPENFDPKNLLEKMNMRFMTEKIKNQKNSKKYYLLQLGTSGLLISFQIALIIITITKEEETPTAGKNAAKAISVILATLTSALIGMQLSFKWGERSREAAKAAHSYSQLNIQTTSKIQMLECGGKLGDLTKFWQDAFWKEAGIEESKNNSKQVV